MTSIKTILAVLFLAFVVVIGLTFVKKPTTYAPTQSPSTVENLNSDLNSLDATDLDTGANAQLDKISSDSSSF